MYGNLFPESYINSVGNSASVHETTVDALVCTVELFSFRLQIFFTNTCSTIEILILRAELTNN